ncbi:MAG: hypothetical protein JWN08_1198 [Frankiales bacterium]|nr:hypothetical protein [Frankiales bacterium]
MSVQPDADDQASVTLFGPAVPLTRWHRTLDERAHALKHAGDPRPLDALRFDLATSTFPCATHAPADPSRIGTADPICEPDAPARTTTPDTPPVTWGSTPSIPSTARTSPPGTPPAADDTSIAASTAAAAAGLRPAFVEAAPTDCRMSRPVQASIVVPVETALGLSQEPGWLDGDGWLSAPTSRLLLVDAELRRLCAHTSTGQLLELANRAVRPPPTPAGVHAGLLDLVLDTATLTGITDRIEPQHDPSQALRQFTVVRDRHCDGPTGTHANARRNHPDHDTPHPTGPTAAWNLAARSTHTHQLKHDGWTPLHTPTGTYWTSPTGQLIHTPHHTSPPPGIDTDHETGTGPASLPDPDQPDRGQLEHHHNDTPPWLPTSEHHTTQWTWLTGNDRDDDIAC